MLECSTGWMGHDWFNKSLMMGVWMSKMKIERHLVESEKFLSACVSSPTKQNTMNRKNQLSEDGETLTERRGFLSGVTGLWTFKTLKEQYQVLRGPLTMGSLRVGHDWATWLSLFTFMHWRRKWQPTPVFLSGESQGRGSLVGCRLWGRTESDTTEAT